MAGAGLRHSRWTGRPLRRWHPDGALPVIDAGINAVHDGQRTQGVSQNRPTSVLHNLEDERENQVAAESRLWDRDVAPETADLARSPILSEAAVAGPAQPSQAARCVLQFQQQLDLLARGAATAQRRGGRAPCWGPRVRREPRRKPLKSG